MHIFRVQRHFVLILIIGALGFSQFPQSGQAAEEARLSLKALVEEAIARNPAVRSARERWEASKAIIPQVQTLPDPEVKLGYQRIPAVSPIEGAVYGFGQNIPFPGKLRLRGEVAARQADRLEQEYLAFQLRVVAHLKETYFDLHFVHKAIEIVEKNKLLLVQFEKTAKARYAVGQASQQDVFRTQVEISRVLDRLAVLEQEKESLHAAINRLLNWPPSDPLGTPEEIDVTPLALSFSELNRLAEDFSPILLANVKGIERAQQGVDQARKEYFPDFGLNAVGLRTIASTKMGTSFPSVLAFHCSIRPSNDKVCVRPWLPFQAHVRI